MDAFAKIHIIFIEQKFFCKKRAISLITNIALFSWPLIMALQPLSSCNQSGISQPTADAPSTAAEEPSRPLTRNFALPLKMLSTLAL